MVDVGMGDQHIVDVVGGKVQGIVVVLILPLLQAAVDENFFTVDLQAVAAAGYRVGGAAKMSVSWNSLLLCTIRVLVSIVHHPREKSYTNL